MFRALLQGNTSCAKKYLSFIFCNFSETFSASAHSVKNTNMCKPPDFDLTATNGSL